MKKPIELDGYVRCTGISDEDVQAMARAALGKIKATVKAMPGKFVAWIAPFRKVGTMEIPWDFQGNSAEAVMVSDGTGADVPQGTLIMVRPDEGFLHEVDGVELCFLPKSALLLAQLA